jgi:hypothetical protein
MARKSIFAVPNRMVSGPMSLPAPTGGLNARDSLATMQPNQAVRLENMFPLQYGVRVRKGWKRWATDLPSNVDTLMTYSKYDGTQELFAASGGYFYDVSAEGPVGAPVAPAVGNFTNNRWQYVNMTNVFGTFIVAVNGEDDPQIYDGTSWTAATITADMIAYPTFDAKRFIHAQMSHRRIWFVEKDSGNAWYLPVDSVSGQVSFFNVGEIFPHGGYLQAIGVWSIDSGSGMDDHTVFISSEGDIAVFSGYDPDDITTFSLVGVYRSGAPIGRRCQMKMGGDLVVLGEDGIIPLSGILSQSRAVSAKPLSDLIQQKLSQDVTTYGANFGWEVMVIPRHQMLMVNVPRDADRKQYVMNSVTEAWCEFTGYDALCWALFEQEPFFGSQGYVARAWYADMDDYDTVNLEGLAIAAVATQAFNYFGSTALQKRWTLVRPTFNAANSPSLRLQMSVDFDLEDTLIAPPQTIATPDGSLWDFVNWDEGTWVGSTQSIKRWYSLGQLGYCGALTMKLSTIAETTWVATDFVYEQGGVL